MFSFSANKNTKHFLCWAIALSVLCLGGTPGTVKAQDEIPTLVNRAADIRQMVATGQKRWRLNGLELPSASAVDLEFKEVEVFAENSAVLTARNGKFIQTPRESIRVFLGRVAGASPTEDLVVLLSRGNGDLQGRWHGREAEYELNMDSEDAFLKTLEVETREKGGNPFLNDQVFVPNDPSSPQSKARREALSPSLGTTATLLENEIYTVTIAIDTDFALVQALGSVGNVTAYMASLFAYLNATYEEEISTRLLIGQQIIPTSSSEDPYSSWTGYGDRLDEVTTRYTGNTSINRALLAHFSPSGGDCGIAISPVADASSANYGGVLCDENYGFSVNNVDAIAPASNTPISSTWDAIVAAHEIGHNFNSPHTHCYGGLNASTSSHPGLTNSSNPVDSCYVAEVADPRGTYSCASGSISLPGQNSLVGGSNGGGDGTIMSYCHVLFQGGLSNISRTFGTNHTRGIQASRVSERMSLAVANAYSYNNTRISKTSTSSTNSFSLTTSKTGSGTGTFSSNPTGISCGSDCSANFSQGTSVTLTATPDTGSEFTGWGGGCSGTGACEVAMSSNQSVVANFDAIPAVSLAEALDAPSPTWTTGGDANWAGQTAVFHALDDNDDAAQSGEITHNQSTYIETTVSGPGAIDFYWSVSSEAGYDFLSFYVDGALIERISGEVYWTQVTHDVAGEGDHTLRWVFNMDVNTDNGVDKGWVDLVTWGEAETPNAPTLISVATEQTTSLTGSATVSFSPAATGPVADSYVATCTPQSASRQVANQVRLSGDVPSAEEFAALTSRPSKAETDALKQLHQAETFRDSGARCGSDAINSRNSNVPRTQADCTNSLTVIKSSYEAPADGTYVIPIVWHVIYKTDTAQTGLLSAEDIADQIDALNEDYAGFLGAGIDTNIQFVLEDIKYYENDAAYDDTSSAAYDLKDQNKVDGTRFLNVFSNDAQGYLGYAWFPVWGVGASGDFVTMNAAYVGGRSNGAGVFDEGRTLVHEIGHYLGLIHTFGDDETCGGNTYSSSDLIVDTPEQKFADYSQASSDCGVTSALNNFMNYSYDDLMYTFTEEQTNRMICSLQNYRSAAYELVSDGPTAVTVTATGTTSPIVVPDLVAGATYQCSVAAVAGTQESASSSSGTIMAGDHDGDGVLDYDDAFPNDPTETTDTDGEGLGDNLEGTLGTDINNPDTDGDGYTDYEEYVDGTDPLDDGDPGSGGLPIWLLYQATQ